MPWKRKSILWPSGRHDYTLHIRAILNVRGLKVLKWGPKILFKTRFQNLRYFRVRRSLQSEVKQNLKVYRYNEYDFVSCYTPFLEGSKTLPFQIPSYFILKCKSRDCSWNRWFSSVTGSQTTTQKWWQKNDRSDPKLIYKDVFCDWRERRTRPDLTVTSLDCTNNLHPTFIQPSQFTQEQLFNSFPRSELELDQQWSVVLFIRWGLSRVIKND